ncbi:VapA/VapB family virulence-associated protein [Caenispirillum bisanense]|uniref:VapA/VapB family virulence-associated protein n=1 Tax=Caenispirillum bisanense TaxID=414052 RepID=UPI0031E438FD
MFNKLVTTKEILAHDMVSHLQGKLPDDKLQAAVERLLALTNKYPATGNVASLIFYLKVQVSITGGKTFNGNAGGAALPGGGANFGDVYTDDIDRLYRDTVSFQVNSTYTYFNVNFFDRNSYLLGHYQAGAISTVTGIGGGTGSWS